MNRNVMETLKALGIETNAALNTGAGAQGEAVPTEEVRSAIMDLVPDESTLLSFLPGNQNKALGRALEETEKVVVVGEVPEFYGGEAEQTGGFTTPAEANGDLQVDKVLIEQNRFELTFDITRKLGTYSAVNFLDWLKREAPKAMARTIDSVILNGDNATSGNINHDESAPPANANYTRVGGDGIRKRGLNSNGLDLAVIEFQDYLDALASLGIYASDPSQLLWIFNNETYIKSMGLTEFKNASENGKKSIIHDGKKALTNILGADLVSLRSFRKTKANGKISTTASNNTKGGFSLLWTPAVQYGFGENFKYKIFDMGSRGVKLNMWYDFGFGIVNPADVGITDGKAVATGFNATL